MIQRPPRSTLFPYTRSSDLSRASPSPSTSRAARSSSRGACSPSRSEEHTSELQSQSNLVCRLLLEKKNSLMPPPPPPPPPLHSLRTPHPPPPTACASTPLTY